ncbi:MAG: hypothetical protein M1536_03855 [Firmicutes bacterium]|nr:hypothetical protein [Bacillota bacterium]
MPTVSYFYGVGQILQERGGASRFSHTDGLGSTIALTDETGTVTDAYDYDVWGAILPPQPGDPPNQSYNKKKFTGQILDDDTGLLYLRARYYDQSLRRFISTDPDPGNIDDPLSMSPYLYCRNSPTNLTDPSGENPILVWLARLAGAAMTAARTPAGQRVINAVTNVASRAGSAVVNAASRAGNALAGAARTVGNAAASAARIVGNAAVSAGRAVANTASNVYWSATQKLYNASSAVSQFTNNVWNRITGNSGATNTPASTTVGRLGSPMKVTPGTNSPANIGGRQYTGHSLDRMQGRGLTPSVVEDTISRGTTTAGRGGATIYTTEQAGSS